MKVAYLTGLGKFEIPDVPSPVLEGDTDVLLRIHSVGVCGSDAHYFRTGEVGDIVVQYPLVLGHECSAIVEKTGKRVTRVRPGDRVVVDPAIACGTCDQCRARRPHTCRAVQFLSYPGQRDGCLAEFIAVPERNCYPMPEAMTMAEGALIEPLSIGMYAVDLWKKVSSPAFDDLTHDPSRAGKSLSPGSFSAGPIGVLGAGSIGLCVILAARAQNFEKIYSTDKVDVRGLAAARSGAVWAKNPEKADIVNEILEREPLGLDAVFECCGDQAALDQAVELLKPGGTLFILGIPIEERISFDISALRRKEIRIQNVRRQNGFMAGAIEAVSQGRINIRFLATHTYRLEDTHQAFETAATYADGVLKAIITVG